MTQWMKGFLATALIVFVTAPSWATRQESRRYDAAIQTAAQGELNKKEKFQNVRASAEDGIITLGGSVELFQHKLDAERTVRKLERVQGIRNFVEVAGPAVPDAELSQKLADKLRYDRIGRGIVFNHLSLAVRDGMVTVSGNVRDYPDRDSALAIVSGTPGVRGLVSEIEVAPASSFDDDLRVRLARAIYGHPTMTKYGMDPQAPIRIVVEGGKVALHGVVDTSFDKQLALSQANSVPGAFTVEDNLMVKSDLAR